ncbi:hypothetical protein HALLA_11975 [Halostagnicola larsenii XH-48]|uniref:Uncharacterized protein n=1 Tax=Halostagnicola larsenii XH-48 TaxID=797299 RepID=W0JQE3_9EURY|nr:hypothetical protein [Halostagnicola larsenii]AHG00899.1 hypothetical protein HALLA_11685 [Halostagnicola larsenii XH-48]AHG00946.1 hypothetical protein HALLA_11975 [Halostagnicola larsenii XH-48]
MSETDTASDAMAISQRALGRCLEIDDGLATIGREFGSIDQRLEDLERDLDE